jgi:hypothetical protein
VTARFQSLGFGSLTLSVFTMLRDDRDRFTSG